VKFLVDNQLPIALARFLSSLGVECTHVLDLGLAQASDQKIWQWAKVSEKGGVSVYGLGRFPVTLYYEQWVRLSEHGDELKGFLEENRGKLKLRPKE
jgi:hypothetical protein